MNLHDYVEVSDDWAKHCEAVVRERMDELDEWFFADEGDELEGEPPETPSGLPYDACPECTTREVMVLTTMLIVEGMRLGHVLALRANPEIAGDLGPAPLHSL